LSSKKTTYKSTLDLIADILNFETSNDQVREKLQAKTVDWDYLVKLSSEHLVMTTCYCRLEQRQLLSFIPDELKSYLREITTINRNRNVKIAQEIKAIAAIFNENNIDYALLKGAALLVGNYYNDLGERMIGDIDILISDKHIDNAFYLLKKANYTSLIKFNYDNKNFRHLARQVNQDKIAAVELHYSVLNTKHKIVLDDKKLLLNTIDIDGIRIPNTYFLNLSNILTAQLNSNGYRFKSWHLKNIYDSLCLKLDQQTGLVVNKYTIDYISKLKAIIGHDKFESSELFNSTIAKKYTFAIKNYKIYNFWYKLNLVFHSLKNRIVLFISNKSYRQHVIKNKLF